MTKDELRKAMPLTAAIVDTYRELLGDGGRLVYASENGFVIDRREPVDPSKVFDIPENYHPTKPFQVKR